MSNEETVERVEGRGGRLNGHCWASQQWHTEDAGWPLERVVLGKPAVAHGETALPGRPVEALGVDGAGGGTRGSGDESGLGDVS